MNTKSGVMEYRCASPSLKALSPFSVRVDLHQNKGVQPGNNRSESFYEITDIQKQGMLQPHDILKAEHGSFPGAKLKHRVFYFIRKSWVSSAEFMEIRGCCPPAPEW